MAAVWESIGGIKRCLFIGLGIQLPAGSWGDPTAWTFLDIATK